MADRELDRLPVSELDRMLDELIRRASASRGETAMSMLRSLQPLLEPHVQPEVPDEQALQLALQLALTNQVSIFPPPQSP